MQPPAPPPPPPPPPPPSRVPAPPRTVHHGRPYVPQRPSVPMIVLLVGSTVAGGLVLLGVLGGSLAYTGSIGLAVWAILLAALPLPFTLGLVLLVDRLEPEPLPELALALLWGAGGSVLLAGVANGLGGQALSVYAGTATDYLTATLVAPVTEELLKGALLIGYLRFRRHHLDSLTDGIVYATVVALGFAATENVTYYLDAGLVNGSSGVASLFVLRGLITPLAHPLFTAATGIGVAVAATRRAHRWAPVAGLVVAIALHGLWNGLAGLAVLTGDAADGFAGLTLAYGALFLVFVAVAVVLVRDRRTFAGQLRTHLAPYVASGDLLADEVEMLTTTAQRRTTRRALRSRRGPAGERAARAFQRAATDLALLHRRVLADGHTLDEVEPERQHHLARVRAARAAIGA